MRQIYLDYNASTPVAPAVAERICEFAGSAFGNPSSGHWAGAAARDAVERARASVARLLACEPGEIVFTSGGSEANNLAIKGMMLTGPGEAGHMITTAIEHPAVLQPCRFLRRFGVEITELPVDGHGIIDPDDLRRALRPSTRLISIMHANNEVGSIQPITDCARIAREAGIVFHTDAAQSVAKIPTRVDELNVDLLSLAGHKLYAPKGVGALYVRSGLSIEPLIHGASHESGRRAGTESAMLSAALGTACELSGDPAESERVKVLRDRLWDGLQARLGDRVVLNGHPQKRLPNTLNVSFPGESGPELLARLDGVAASTGSACHQGTVDPSPVLLAMQRSAEVARGAIRFSLGRYSVADDVDQALERIRSALTC